MGLFGGSKSTSYSGSAQKWAQPFAKNAATAVQNVFANEQPYIEKTATAVKSTIPSLTSNFQGWQPTLGQSQDYYGDVLSGDYLDPSNYPGLSSVLDRMRGDISDEVNSQFSMAGRYGSGAHTGVLTDRLADAEGNILYGNYNAERARQDAAAGAVPQAQNQGLAALLQSAGVSAELPFAGTNALAGQLSSLFSGGTQTSKSSGGIGGLLGGVGSLASGVAGMKF